MEYKIKKVSGEELVLHSDSKYEAEKYKNAKRNFDHTFFERNGIVIAHHGIKGMKWGVHNEETKQKYGETGSGNFEGGGGGVLDEEDVDSDESRDAENKDTLSSSQIKQMKEFEERADPEYGIKVTHVKDYDKNDFWKTHPIGEHDEYSYRNKYDKKDYPLDKETVENGKFNKEYKFTHEVVTGQEEYEYNGEIGEMATRDVKEWVDIKGRKTKKRGQSK